MNYISILILIKMQFCTIIFEKEREREGGGNREKDKIIIAYH